MPESILNNVMILMVSKRLLDYGKHALIFWFNRQEYLQLVLDFLAESRAIA